MNITETNIEVLRVADLHPNEGQLASIGVPANPRTIDKDEYAKLKRSMKRGNLTGVMPLKVFQHATGELIVLGGNMRLRALKELKIESVSCILVPFDADAETLREIVIKDNSTFGDFDNDMLANEWDADELREWGVDVPPIVEDEEPDDLDGEAKEKPFVAKLTFGSDAKLQAFVVKYNKQLHDEYGCVISVSGGEL